MAPSYYQRSVLFGLIHLLAFCSAQSSSEAQPPSSTSSGPAHTFTITVGDGGYKFVPDVTQANIGDIIEFDFFPPNHSVVRAEYEYPCIPYEMTGRGKVGFFSGFKPVDAVLQNPPKWTVKINDSKPVFFYCSAVGSCIDYGMVGVINPNATTSLETQRELARNSTYMLNPGEPFPPESEVTSSASSPTSTSTASSTTIASAGGATAIPTHHSTLTRGAIAGVAVAAAVVLSLAALLCFFIGRSRTLKQEMTRGHATLVRPEPPLSPSPMYSSDTMRFAPLDVALKRGVSNGGSNVGVYEVQKKEEQMAEDIWGRARSPGFGRLGQYRGVDRDPSLIPLHSPPFFPSMTVNPGYPQEMEGSSPSEHNGRLF